MLACDTTLIRRRTSYTSYSIFSHIPSS